MKQSKCCSLKNFLIRWIGGRGSPSLPTYVFNDFFTFLVVVVLFSTLGHQDCGKMLKFYRFFQKMCISHLLNISKHHCFPSVGMSSKNGSLLLSASTMFQIRSPLRGEYQQIYAKKSKALEMVLWPTIYEIHRWWGMVSWKRGVNALVDRSCKCFRLNYSSDEILKQKHYQTVVKKPKNIIAKILLKEEWNS